MILLLFIDSKDLQSSLSTGSRDNFGMLKSADVDFLSVEKEETFLKPHFVPGRTF